MVGLIATLFWPDTRHQTPDTGDKTMVMDSLQKTTDEVGGVYFDSNANKWVYWIN